MKYRRLTLEELKPLENEFIDFLVVNGVIADDWEQLLANDVEKSNQIIDAFIQTFKPPSLQGFKHSGMQTFKHSTLQNF